MNRPMRDEIITVASPEEARFPTVDFAEQDPQNLHNLPLSELKIPQNPQKVETHKDPRGVVPRVRHIVPNRD